MDLISTLSNIPLFKGLSTTLLSELSSILVAQVLAKGQIIFSEGDPGSGFFVVISGRVKVYKLSPGGKEQILHIFGPGEPFGEVPVFAGRNFPATAETMEKSGIFYFPRKDFVALIRRNPDLALGMLGVLSERLRRFAGLVEDLSLKEVPGRLAAHLLFLCDRQANPEQVRLDVSKAQLASVLGTIPETLSRILGRMKGAGLIALEGPTIHVLDRQGLEDLAAGRGSL